MKLEIWANLIHIFISTSISRKLIFLFLVKLFINFKDDLSTDSDSSKRVREREKQKKNDIFFPERIDGESTEYI